MSISRKTCNWQRFIRTIAFTNLFICSGLRTMLQSMGSCERLPNQRTPIDICFVPTRGSPPERARYLQVRACHCQSSMYCRNKWSVWKWLWCFMYAYTSPCTHCRIQRAVQQTIRQALMGPIFIGSLGAEIDEFLTKLLLEQRCSKEFWKWLHTH